MLGVDVKDKILSGRNVPEAEVNLGILTSANGNAAIQIQPGSFRLVPF